MITAILTVWKRNNVEEQIQALLSQTIPPQHIWIYHCKFNVLPDMELCKKFPMVKYQVNTSDLGYFGRFSLALHADTPYVYILDDDVIPSAQWLESCIKNCVENNSIVSSTGRIIPKDDFMPELPKPKEEEYIGRYFIGDSREDYAENYCETATYVDFGCNSWFFKTEWLTHFWGTKPYTYITGEDVHLSTSCLLSGGIRTMVPFQDGKQVSGNMKKEYGYDDYASWKSKDFIKKRESVFRFWIENKLWSPINW